MIYMVLIVCNLKNFRFFYTNYIQHLAPYLWHLVSAVILNLFSLSASLKEDKYKEAPQNYLF